MSNVSWDLESGGKNSAKVEFTNFPVGTTIIRVLDEAPHIRWTHWMNQFRRSVNCPGVRECPIDDISNKQRANKEKPTYSNARKYSLNIYNYETQRLEIMEQGITFLEDLKMIMQDLKEENKKLSDVTLRVRRTGTGKDDTKYRIDINEHIDDAIPEGVVNLNEYFKPHTREQITQLLAVKGSNADDFRDAWNEIMSTNTQDDNDEDIGLE